MDSLGGLWPGEDGYLIQALCFSRQDRMNRDWPILLKRMERLSILEKVAEQVGMGY